MFILLVFTGIHGYRKVNQNKIEDSPLFILTLCATLAPILSILLARNSEDPKARNNIWLVKMTNTFNILIGILIIILIKIAICKQKEYFIETRKQKLIEAKEIKL